MTVLTTAPWQGLQVREWAGPSVHCAAIAQLIAALPARADIARGNLPHTRSNSAT